MTGGPESLGGDLVGRRVLVQLTLDELRRRHGSLAEVACNRLYLVKLLAVDSGFAMLEEAGQRRWVNLACVAAVERAP